MRRALADLRQLLPARRPLLSASGMAVLAACTLACHPATPPRPSTIVLVTVDTLRSDRTSFDGYRLPTTPFLDRLAREGVVFENAYATSSWTPPTMASIFTGVPPSTHGVVSGEMSESRKVRQPILPRSLPTIAERLQRLGFRTLGASSSRHLTADLGFARGFDRFADAKAFLAGVAVNRNLHDLLVQEFGAGGRQKPQPREGAAGGPPPPLFLWAHYFDPHDPYIPEPEWISAQAPGVTGDEPDSPAFKVMLELKSLFPAPDAALAERIRPFYDSEIHRTDKLVESLFQELALDENALFILVADHGEGMAERGLLGHSQNLYNELVHVPMIFWWPRGIPAGVRVERPVSTLDILPTILALLGEKPGNDLAGHALIPVWSADAPETAAAPVFFELDPPKPRARGVVEGKYKLIFHPAQPASTELYDLSRDPGEKHNLATEMPDEVRRLRGQLVTWTKAHPGAPDRETRESSDEGLREDLQALGYLDDGPQPAEAPEP
ncbi:MAG: sulfatase [Thermoanaerobaculia bacterium]